MSPLELLGAHEILELAGWKTRKSISDAMRDRGFPKPVAHLKCGQVWEARAVRAWVALRIALKDTSRA